jgi:hypothetical protein
MPLPFRWICGKCHEDSLHVWTSREWRSICCLEPLEAKVDAKVEEMQKYRRRGGKSSKLNPRRKDTA